MHKSKERPGRQGAVGAGVGSDRSGSWRRHSRKGTRGEQRHRGTEAERCQVEVGGKTRAGWRGHMELVGSREVLECSVLQTG